jgi:hypothetical protein
MLEEPKKKKTRKPAMKNQEVIDKLYKAGYMTQSNIKDKTTEFSKIWKEYDRYNSPYYSYNDLGIWKPRYIADTSYYIPLDVYKKVIAKKYKPEFKIGSIVRLCRSKRKYKRRKFNQDVGNSQDWQHLGIGTGKEYHSQKIKDSINIRWSWARRSIEHRYNSKLLIGNDKYVPNLFDSINKFNYYHAKGIKIKPKSHYYWHDEWGPSRFFKNLKIKGNGIFGPKKLINGYITNVFIHFIHPKWERKRESRYEILFETGAKGIFTNDYIERVFDTDYDRDDSLCGPCVGTLVCPILFCKHRYHHIREKECYKSCEISSGIDNSQCPVIFDYSTLGEMTYGTVTEDDDS